jgi:hypothetical protein
MVFGHNSATFTPANGTCKNCSVIAPKRTGSEFA